MSPWERAIARTFDVGEDPMDGPNEVGAGITAEELQIRTHPPAPRSGRSMGELLRDIGTDTATLVRKEVELAKQELTDAVTARLMAGGAFAVAAVMVLFVLGFLGLAAASALDYVVPAWASRLIVAGVYLVIAGGAAVFARARIKNPPMAPEETKRTVKEDIEWAKAQLKR
jgi:Putative Actinobacterial Holin-X, holin superfamily III